VFLKNLQIFSFEEPQVLLKKPAGKTCVEKTCLEPCFENTLDILLEIGNNLHFKYICLIESLLLNIIAT
jgi:hypothetical protein